MPRLSPRVPAGPKQSSICSSARDLGPARMPLFSSTLFEVLPGKTRPKAIAEEESRPWLASIALKANIRSKLTGALERVLSGSVSRGHTVRVRTRRLVVENE
eukprot:5767692-Pleurochrysis_carterae.AAC.1